MTRNIDAPGILLNEIDRSQYNNTVDYSLPNSPNILIAGFADNGEDYTAKWINSKNTLIELYGYPTNEAEKYFYNACVEVLANGGTCIATKLPYYNNAKDMYSYMTYEVDNLIIQLNSPYTIANNIISSDDIKVSLFKYMLMPDIEVSALNLLLTENYTNINTEGLLQLREYIGIDGQALTSNNNILDIYDRNNAILIAITDLFEYIFSKCSISIEDQEVLKIIFYRTDNDNYALNKACYMLKYLCENDVTAFLSKYSIDEKYTDNLKRIRQSILNVSEFNTFNNLYTNYGKSKSIIYYKLLYEYLNTLLLQNENDNKFIHDIIDSFKNTNLLNLEYTDIAKADNSISKLRSIKNISKNNNGSGLLSFNDYDDLKTGSKLRIKNLIVIVDKTRQKYYNTNLLSGDSIIRDVDCLGIIPIITTAANAMLAQGIIERTSDTLKQYSPIADIIRINSLSNALIYIDEQNYTTLLSSDDVNSYTMSDNVSEQFPIIDYDTATIINRLNLKKIGVLVYKLEKANGSENKLQLTLVERFIGSFDKNAKDLITHSTLFIDNIVNEQSQYINLFSNVDETADFDIYNTVLLPVTSLGFYKSDLVKDISYIDSILTPLQKIFDACQDPNQVPIDLILDAGVSNIAQYITSVYSSTNKGEFDLTSNLSYLFKLTSQSDTNAWKTVLLKYDNFCSKIRKDCMFIADGLRTFCLQGNEKLVRNGNFNNTFSNTILPKLKYMIGLNSSYSAGYCNWFRIYDDYSNDAFWCPPSIKAASVYIYSDVYYHKWDAPAGINRGTINAVDIAFNPTNEEAGKLYNQAWNYAVSYPIAGIIQEGLKTFQRRQTAFDRVNVRKLFLHLEKNVSQVAKYFLYEGNTAYIRLKFVDTITPLFEDAVNGNGIAEYLIRCDDTNNTSTTIDRNELHCTIGVRPIKSIEFIILNFICTNLSTSLVEEIKNIV